MAATSEESKPVDGETSPIAEDTTTTTTTTTATAVAVAPSASASGGGSSAFHKLLKEHKIVVIRTTWCPFCIRVHSLFQDFKVEKQMFEINLDDADKAAENQKLWEEAQADPALAHETVPAVYINGKRFGGCDDTCAYADTGILQRELDLPSMDLPFTKERQEPAWPGLFLFGPVSDRHTAQFTSLQVCILCVICIVWREHRWVHFLTLGIAADFVIRVFFGGTPSVNGSIAHFVSNTFFHPELTPGAPKQFAAFCGLFFSSFAFCLFLPGKDDTQNIGGSIMIGMLAVAAGLEGFLNFCLGCFFFSLAVRFGIFPPTMYQFYSDTALMSNYSINDFTIKRGFAKQNVEKPPVGAIYNVPEDSIPAGTTDKGLLSWRRPAKQAQPVPVPVWVKPLDEPGRRISHITEGKYKFPKTDDTWREQWSGKYISFEDFGMVLGIAGLAVAYELMILSFGNEEYVPKELWQFIAILAAVIYGAMLLALLYKTFVYPEKIVSEMMNPFKRNTLSTLPLINLTFSWLVRNESDTFRRILFWAGAPFAAVHFLFMVMVWIKNRHFSDHLNPGVIFPIATMIYTAFIMTTFPDGEFLEAASWFFNIGAFFLIVYWVTTFAHGLTYHWSDDRVRPSVGLWAGSLWITQLAYAAIYGSEATSVAANGFGPVMMACFATGCSLFVICLWLIYPGKWLLRGRFEMSNWALAFPLDVFAIAGVQYHSVYGHRFSQGVMYVGFIFATYANFTMFMHTLTGLCTGRWPRPAQKWAPLSFNKLQHEAMRVMIAKMLAECGSDPFQTRSFTDAEKHNKFLRLKEMWNEYHLLTGNHADFEDTVYFHELRGFSSAVIDAIDKQHGPLHVSMKKANDAIESNNLEELCKVISEDHGPQMLDHMQYEEDHIQPLVRKNMNLALQHHVMKGFWAMTPVPTLRLTFPSTIRHLPMHGQRVRYIKTFLWVMPERAQEIGLWVYEGLGRDPMGEMKWAMLAQDLPEIVPRGGGIDHSRFM